MRAASPFLDGRYTPPFQEYMKLATPYMSFYSAGAGKLSIGPAITFAQQGAAMVVNCAPFGCAPEAVATSVFGRVSDDVDMPILSMFYEGNGLHRQVVPGRASADRIRSHRSAHQLGKGALGRYYSSAVLPDPPAGSHRFIPWTSRESRFKKGTK